MTTSKISKLTKNLKTETKTAGLTDTSFGREVGVEYAKKPGDEKKAGGALDDVAKWSSELRENLKKAEQAGKGLATTMKSAKAILNEKGMKESVDMAQNAANGWIRIKKQVDTALKRSGLKV